MILAGGHTLDGDLSRVHTWERPRVFCEAGADCVACVPRPLACIAGPPVALRLPRRPTPAPPSGPEQIELHVDSLLIMCSAAM